MVGFNIIKLLATSLPAIVATFAICKQFGPSSDQVRHLDLNCLTGFDSIPVRKKKVMLLLELNKSFFVELFAFLK